jgi:hypothetical protein
MAAAAHRAIAAGFCLIACGGAIVYQSLRESLRSIPLGAMDSSENSSLRS